MNFICMSCVSFMNCHDQKKSGISHPEKNSKFINNPTNIQIFILKKGKKKSFQMMNQRKPINVNKKLHSSYNFMNIGWVWILPLGCVGAVFVSAKNKHIQNRKHVSVLAEYIWPHQYTTTVSLDLYSHLLLWTRHTNWNGYWYDRDSQLLM